MEALQLPEASQTRGHCSWLRWRHCSSELELEAELELELELEAEAEREAAVEAEAGARMHPRSRAGDRSLLLRRTPWWSHRGGR